MRILGEGVRELQDVAGIFSEYEGCPIALYGLGIQTEETITSLDRKFQIVGLMDSLGEMELSMENPSFRCQRLPRKNKADHCCCKTWIMQSYRPKYWRILC